MNKYFDEISMLEVSLDIANIPHTLQPLYDGWQIICDGWDAICHSDSYGHEDGLLEVYGNIVPDSWYDEVMGELTANEVMDLVWDSMTENEEDEDEAEIEDDDHVHVRRFRPILRRQRRGRQADGNANQYAALEQAGTDLIQGLKDVIGNKYKADENGDPKVFEARRAQILEDVVDILRVSGLLKEVKR